MSLRYLGGFITASYNPLKVPNPPTIVSATAGVGQVSVVFTAPSNVGGSAITSFLVLVTDSSSGATFSNTGSASPIVVTGLTAGNNYTAKVLAVNSYGPSAFSAPSGSFVPVAPKLFSWGLNTYGQLGINTTTSRSSPTQIGALTNWAEIELAQFGESCGAIKTDGTLWTWGRNNLGQLGRNNRGSAYYQSSPVQVGGLTNWSRISVGNSFCASVKTDGTLWTWGDNDDGQLGLGNSAGYNRSSPAQVGALTDWSKISAGSTSCFAIKTNGTLWTWGQNNFGQLGRDNTIKLSSPVQLGSLTWSEVSGGSAACAAITTSGTLFTWGRNVYSGQLGLGDDINRSSPVQVGALTDWSKVHMGYQFCTAIKTDGTLWSWGRNGYGQLGDNSVIYKSSPVKIGALTNWSQTAAGQHCMAIKTDGTLWTWGFGDDGQLGSGNITKRSSPVQVGSLATWSKISAGRNTSAAILN